MVVRAGAFTPRFSAPPRSSPWIPTTDSKATTPHFRLHSLREGEEGHPSPLASVVPLMTGNHPDHSQQGREGLARGSDRGRGHHHRPLAPPPSRLPCVEHQRLMVPSPEHRAHPL